MSDDTRIYTKVLSGKRSGELQAQLATELEFLDDQFKEIVDIKFSASNSDDDWLFAALIIYK